MVTDGEVRAAVSSRNAAIRELECVNGKLKHFRNELDKAISAIDEKRTGPGVVLPYAMDDPPDFSELPAADQMTRALAQRQELRDRIAELESKINTVE